MKTDIDAINAIGRRTAFRSFAAMLAVCVLLACAFVRPIHYGDIQEYVLTTVALANHASPDIRQQDIVQARELIPEYAPLFDPVRAGIDSGAGAPQAGVLRGRDGFYAMHFFTYPALAAVPFTLLRALHLDPLRCYLLVNSAALFVLGIALFRLFGSASRAWLGVALYLLCGGMLYWQWSSPETLSAIGLLAGLLLFCTGAPVSGGLLAGLGATQNPPLILFCAFAPLLRGVLAKGGSLTRREIAGLALCVVLALVPAAFDLIEFHTPSIIGELATDPTLVTAGRLQSFFFDLNQGMVLGIPALAIALLCWQPRNRITWLACAFAAAMALPSLAATNWNSGAVGIMRYALWASMPLVFAFLWQLRHAPRWPRGLVLAVLAGQALAMAHARSYTNLEFSPLAKQVMELAPGAYNPEPEIFAERLRHRDAFADLGKAFTWTAGSGASKTLYDTNSEAASSQLCGPGRTVAPDNRYVDAGRGWRYVDGEVACMRAGAVVGQPGLVLESGWSAVEHAGSIWDGAWSDAPQARIMVRVDPRHWPASITLHGHYAPGASRTRVTINGVERGWHPLDQLPALPVPPKPGPGDTLAVELQFDATSKPAPGDADQRRLGFFLQKVTLK